MNSDHSLSEVLIINSSESSPMLSGSRSHNPFSRIHRPRFVKASSYQIIKNSLLILTGMSLVSIFWLTYNISNGTWPNQILQCKQSLEFANCVSIISNENPKFQPNLQPPFLLTQKPLSYADLSIKPSFTTKDNLYGVVFDAGSTGSRVHVFKLIYNYSTPLKPYVLTSEVFEQVKPGLSAYADHPDKAANSLSDLITIAEQTVPHDLCSSTPLILRATAGLRLLPSNKADNILKAVRKRLSNTCFLKVPESVSILDGYFEGLYLWISLNFLGDRLSVSSSSLPNDQNSHYLLRTIGTLDLGGGSTQITFAPSDPVSIQNAPKGFITKLGSFGNSDNNSNNLIYSHSYLGLGLMSARYSMFHTLTRRLSSEFNKDLQFYYPCWPPNITTYWNHGGRDWKISYLHDSQTSHILSSFEYDATAKSLNLKTGSDDNLFLCYGLALSVLRSPVEGESASPIFPPFGYVVHQPSELNEREFYAFSYYFDLASNAGLIDDKFGGMITVEDFRKAAQSVCNNPKLDKPFECMDLSFITALLHDGYGFAWTKKLGLFKKLKSFEITWSLGALFAELYRNEHV